jgi:hypothetical protein
MGLDRLVTKAVADTIKSSNRLTKSLDSLIGGNITKTVRATESNPTLLDSIPFDLENALRNGPYPPPNEEELKKYNEIPEEEKEQINNLLNSIESSLNSTIVTKNELQGALNQIRGPLDKVENLTTTLAVVVNGLKIAITVIKNIPIPTSVPPGVGIPVNVITRFSNSLDTLSKVVDKTQGPITAITVVIPVLNNILAQLNEKFAALDPVFERQINYISTIRALLEYGPEATQEEIDDEAAKVASGIQESLAVTGNNSSAGINATEDDILLERLKWVTDNPYFYRGWRFILERDPNNTFGFPARRIFTKNRNLNIDLYNTEDGQFSFSSSVQVLIDEAKFIIDRYVKENIQDQNTTESTTTIDLEGIGTINIPPPPPPDFSPFDVPGTVAGEVRFRGGQAYRWLSGQLKWSQFTPTFTPIGRKGDFDGEEETILIQAFPLKREIWEWSELKYQWTLKFTQVL